MEKNEEKKKRFYQSKKFWIGTGTVAFVIGAFFYGKNFNKVNSKVSAGGKYVAGKTKNLIGGFKKNSGATVNVETAPISPTETVETQEKVSVLFSSDGGPKKQPMEYRNNNGGNYNNEYRPREYQNFKKN